MKWTANQLLDRFLSNRALPVDLITVQHFIFFFPDVRNLSIEEAEDALWEYSWGLSLEVW